MIIKPLIVCVCSPGSVGKSSSSLMVAASLSRSQGHTSNATAGSQQQPTAAGTRINRPLQRQPHAIPRSIAIQQPQLPSQIIGVSEQPQLKQILEPPLPVSSLVVSNPIPIPVTPNSPLYVRNKRFKLWGSTRTALSTLFQTNMSYLRKQRKYKKS